MISSLYWIEQNMITSDLSSQHCVCWWNGRRWDRASIDTMLFYKSPHYVIGVHLAICKPAFVRLQINGWEIFWKNSLWYAAITMFSLSASIWIRSSTSLFWLFTFKFRSKSSDNFMLSFASPQHTDNLNGVPPCEWMIAAVETMIDVLCVSFILGFFFALLAWMCRLASSMLVA